MRHKRLRNDELNAAITYHRTAMIRHITAAKRLRWWKPWRWKEGIRAAIQADIEDAVMKAYQHAMEGGRK